MFLIGSNDQTAVCEREYWTRQLGGLILHM